MRERMGVVVDVRIAHAAAVKKQRVIEQRAVAADRDEARDVEAQERDDGVLEELRVLRRVRAVDP